jgi:hypothetical protein
MCKCIYQLRLNYKIKAHLVEILSKYASPSAPTLKQLLEKTNLTTSLRKKFVKTASLVVQCKNEWKSQEKLHGFCALGF